MTSPTSPRRPEGHRDYVKTITSYLGNEMRRISFERSLRSRRCIHSIDERPDPSVLSCSGCDRDGTTWVKLRMCLTCGAVGCCDTSVGRHAVGHFESTGHPVMRSIEPKDTWGWCYVDEAYLVLGGSA